MLQLIKSVTPSAVRRPLKRSFDRLYSTAINSRVVRNFVFDVQDACDWVLGLNEPMKPPRKLTFGIGGGLEVGARYLRFFQELADLRPEEDVLDVGCGIGRMAVPLTTYLTSQARYEGFDIIRSNIAWCRKAITPRYPNFQFRHANIFNREYNVRGKFRGEGYRFPYLDRSFDFVFLTSVFTHLMPDEVANYLREIARVLRPGGRCLATVFVLNRESESLIAEGKSHFVLQGRENGPYRVHSREIPEAAIALDENWFFEKATEAGLKADSPRYGSWCGREEHLDYQDIFVLRLG